jgi:hypothetical protein
MWDDDHIPIFVVIDQNHDIIYEKKIHTMIPFLQSCKICILFLALNKFGGEKAIEDVKIVNWNVVFANT